MMNYFEMWLFGLPKGQQENMFWGVLVKFGNLLSLINLIFFIFPVSRSIENSKVFFHFSFSPSVNPIEMYFKKLTLSNYKEMF